MKILKPAFFIFLWTFLFHYSWAQFARTEQEILQEVEVLKSNQKWEEAISLLLPLYERSPFDEKLYHNLFNLYIAHQKIEEARSLNEKMIQIRRGDPIIALDEVFLLQLENRKRESQSLLDSLIHHLPNHKIKIDQFAHQLELKEDYPNAIKTYLSGREKTGNHWLYASELAYAYTQLGQINEAVAAILDMVYVPRNNMEDVQEAMIRLIDYFPKATAIFKKQITHQIKSFPNEYVWNELWNWFLLTQGDPATATKEMIALDRQLQEEGQRVIPLARYFLSNNEFKYAMELYEYVLDTEKNASFYRQALEGKTRTILENFTYSYPNTSITEETIDKSLQQLLEDFPTMAISDLYRRYIHVKVLYFQKLTWGLEQIQLLITATNKENNPLYLASKLDYADYLVLNQKTWEATIILGQIDKEDPQGIFGTRSRFKSAELAFFRGDFEWAQQVLDILKASTTDYIANDALDLSVLIKEHTQEEKDLLALKDFAHIKLKSRSFNFENTLHEIQLRLQDELLASLKPYYLMEAFHIHYKMANYTEAIASLKEIISFDPDHVLSDDAHFKIAEIYQHKLKNNTLASSYYEQVILNYPSSTYVITSRNALRTLK